MWRWQTVPKWTRYVTIYKNLYIYIYIVVVFGTFSSLLYYMCLFICHPHPDLLSLSYIFLIMIYTVQGITNRRRSRWLWKTVVTLSRVMVSYIRLMRSCYPNCPVLLPLRRRMRTRVLRRRRRSIRRRSRMMILRRTCRMWHSANAHRTGNRDFSLIVGTGDLSYEISKNIILWSLDMTLAKSTHTANIIYSIESIREYVQ